MKKKQPYIHPLNLYGQRIKEEGIVVLDDVRGLPTSKEPFVSPDYVICVGQRGHIDLMYDDFVDYSEKYTVGVIFPNHSLREISKTNDYLASLIVVDGEILNDPLLQIIKQMRYRYEPHPCVKLVKHEYKMIMHVVKGMQETARINIPDKRKLMVRQLEFLLRLLNYYRNQKLNETETDNRVSDQFRNNLIQYYREHRDVGFYAGKTCLSSKHFSAVIKQETGQTASFWIHNQVVSEAKMLLHVRRDLNVQTIADMLGFDDQATFCRYFRRETGMSPTEFRDGF